MKKIELEQKLNNIETKLTQLGDLNSLITNFENQKQQFNSVIQSVNAQQQNIDQIPIKKTELETLILEVKTLQEKLSQNLEESEDFKSEIEELEKKIEETDTLTREQLGVISNEKLSNSFDLRSTNLINDKKRWFKWLVGSTVFLLAVICLVVFWQTEQGDSIFEISFLVKIALTSPIIFFEFFVNREYSRAQELLEEYQFKASVARSFEAYKEIIESSFPDQIGTKDFSQKKLDFILKTIDSLYVSPMENISKNNEKGLSKKESNSLLVDVRNIVSDVRGIVSK